MYKPNLKCILAFSTAMALTLVLAACSSVSPGDSTDSNGSASRSSRPDIIGTWSRIDANSGEVELWKFTHEGYVEAWTLTYGNIKLPYEWVDDSHIRVDYRAVSAGRPIIIVFEVSVAGDALTIKPEGGSAITLNRVSQ